MEQIQHLGIVARDIKDVLLAFRLDMEDVQEVYIDKQQHNTLYFFYLDANSLWLECVVPIDASSTVWTFAKKNGVAMHHLGFLTSSINLERERRRNTQGMFDIGSYSLHIKSFGGHIKTLFFAYKGLIIEFLESLE